MKITPAATCQHPLLSLPPSDLSHKPSFSRKHPHRKNKTYGARFRAKRGGIRPETPPLKWKFDESNGKSNSVEAEEKLPTQIDCKIERIVRPVVSARKLCAGLWRLHFPHFPMSRRRNLGLQSKRCHPWSPTHDDQVGEIHRYPANDMGRGPHYVSVRKNVPQQHKFEPSFQFSNPAMEGSTKWNPFNGRSSGQFNHIFCQTKLLNQQALDAPVIPTLEKELEQARARINELEYERKSSKKKLEQFLQKVNEERAAWKSREHEKVRAIIDDMKAELNREKKNRQRLDIVNSKLVNELTDAKLSVKCYLHEYEKEKKSRELIEEVCDELAKEIEEDNAEEEILKRESRELCEEVEEERKMLQMAEVWREERVQMKLIDAKVMLEEKYTQMNKIITDLEAFLNSKSTTSETKKMELLKEAAASINMQDVRELKYEPPNPDDMFSVFEDINIGEPYSPTSSDSRIHSVNPPLRKDNANTRSNIYTDQSGELEKDSSEWETVSHPEDQGSSYSPNGSDSFRGRNVSREWERNGREEAPSMDGEGGPVQPTKFKKASYISRLWRSHPHDSDNYKIKSVEGVNRNLHNGRPSDGPMTSPDCGELSPQDLAGQWSPLDSGNPHKIRGTKGRVEQKSSLKPQVSGERVESQKIQLRQVLREKI